MKKLIIIMVALVLALQGKAHTDPYGIISDGSFPTVAEYSAYEHTELLDLAVQLRDYSEAFGQAQTEQVIKRLKLTGEKRKEFEKIYNRYRNDIEAVTDPTATDSDISKMSDKTLLEYMSVKLDNIARVSEIKKRYIEPFSEILTASQIRTLYNTEGQVTMIMKKAVIPTPPIAKRSYKSTLKGSGVMVAQNRGAVRNYSAISVSHGIKAHISSSVKELVVTADDNVIGYVQSEVINGELVLRIDARSLSNATVEVAVPHSPSLAQIKASSSANVLCAEPISAMKANFTASSSAIITADVESSTATVSVSSSGRFTGKAECGSFQMQVSSSGKIDAKINAREDSKLNTSSGGVFIGNITANNLDIYASSSAVVKGDFTARQDMLLKTSSSGRINGKVSVGNNPSTGDLSGKCTMAASSSGLIDVTFNGFDFSAQASSGARINLHGASKAKTGNLILSSSAIFNAPDVQVYNYNISVSSGGRATVYAAHTVNSNTSSGGRIVFTNQEKVKQGTLIYK